MDAKKQKRLEAAGWRVGGAKDFLGLSQEEVRLVEVRLGLADYIRDLRRQHHWTQAQVAGRIGSSQSRVAKIEAGDASVSLDLMFKAVFSLGASPGDVAGAISRIA
jgi:DNA-binding XRE family transcriptional regulator